MSKSRLRIIWWIVTFFYIAFIYATLGILPEIWDKLDNFLAGKSVLILFLIYSIVAIIILSYISFIKKERSPVKYLLFFLFIGIIIILVKIAKYPAEKTHIFEYGFLGVLSYNALKIDFDKFGNKLYIYGSIFCLIAGTLDELIQLILPNRYFGWNDVFINALSGLIALLMIKFNILKDNKADRNKNR